MPFVLIAVVLAALMVVWVGFAGLTGQLRPNYWAGIRTEFTTRNADNWNAVHRAAGPVFMFGGVLVVAVGLAFVPFALAGKIGFIPTAIIAGACGGLLIGTVFAGLFAATSFAAARDVASVKPPEPRS